MNLTRKLKAFTLLELIIVMAIIGILASTIMLFIPGFIRDNTIQAYNTNAKLAFTGVQNMLTKCETDQRYLCLFHISELEGGTEKASDITYAQLGFTANGSYIDYVTVLTYYGTGNSYCTTFNFTDTGSRAEVYKLYKEYINKTIGPGVIGKFIAYIDYENYQVESAIYMPNFDDAPFGSKFLGVGNSTEKTFYGCSNYVADDVTDEEDFYKLYGVQQGYYPFIAQYGNANVITDVPEYDNTLEDRK